MNIVLLYTLFICSICIHLSRSDKTGTQLDNTTGSNPGESDKEETTPVVEIFTTEQEPEITLDDLEKELKRFLNRVSSKIFGYAISQGIPPHVSTSCLLNLASVYFGMKRLEPWAFQMMDSSGKFSGGYLQGTSSEFGDYDECLDVIIGGKPNPRAKKGAYCMLEVKPPEPILNALKDYQINKGKENVSLAKTKSFLGVLKKVRSNPNHLMFRVGICMPSACDEYDVQDIVDLVTEKMGVDTVTVKRCEFKKPHEFQVWEIVIMVFLCNVVALSLVGTLVEVCYNQAGCITEDNSILEPGPNALKLRNTWRRSKLFEIISNFSLCTSTKNLLVCNEEGDALDVIRGMKVLTVIFTIYTHTYALPHRLHLYRFRDVLNFAKFIDQVSFGTIANGSVGVDSFFFLAGFIFIYYRWRLFKKPLIFQYIVKFVGVTYIRLLAGQILVLFLFSLFPIIGSGPLWHEFVVEPLKNCANYGWMNVLFIQNFLSPYDSCLYHTWIVANIMQLFILTAFIVFIMHRKPLVGICVNIAVIIVAAIAVSIVTSEEGFPATFAIYFYDFRTMIKYWKYLYAQAYNHIGPFCVGMLTAYLIAEHPPLKIKKPIVISLWAAACATCCAIVFGLYDYREDPTMNRGLAVFYAAVHRPAWGLAMGWIVYACATDNGGFVNCVLTWKALVPIERLCYLAYLIHIPIMYYHGGVQRERMYMGHYNQVMLFFSYMVASFVVSAICYLLFQHPFQTIESYIFGRDKENIWQVEKSSVSTETLKTQNVERSITDITTENSKVLYSRYDQNVPFSEVN